jgi:hypothetical protein
MAMVIVGFLAVMMISTSVPGVVSGDEFSFTENWPVFRPGDYSTFVEPSMAVDLNGSIHLAYTYDPTPGDDYQDTGLHRYSVLLRYATLTNRTWSFSDLGEEEWIQSVTVAVGNHGQPHIVCLQGANLTTWELVHWYRTNDTWTSETVRTFGHMGVTGINTLVDSNDSVHLAFSAALESDFTFKTHVHMTNAGGNWTSDELATVRSSRAVWTNPPQLAMDSQGRLHMAYLNVTDYVIEDWYSGNHSIEFVTLDDGEWGDRQVLNVGTLNRFSFGVDTDGFESVMYQQSDQLWSSGGKVRLAIRYDFGWSYKPYDEDGTPFCKLIMDGDEERMLYQRGSCLNRLEYYANNWIEEPLWIPDGMSLAIKEFAAGPWDHLVLLYFDSLTQSIAVAQPGAQMELVPPTLNLKQDELEVNIYWEPMSTVFSGSCVIYRSGGASFVQQNGTNSFVDDTLNEDSWRHTYQYRMSVLTPDGEEYVGPLTEVWIEPEFGQGALFDVLIAVTVVIAVIVVFILYMNRGKLIR